MMKLYSRAERLAELLRRIFVVRQCRKSAVMPVAFQGFYVLSGGKKTSKKLSIFSLVSILKTIKTDMKKSVFSYGFLTCTIITAILCFTAVIHVDVYGKEYVVLEVIINPEVERLDWFLIVFAACGNLMTMFIPLVAAVPFATVFCSERESGYMRLSILRTGKLAYAISKVITAMLTSGLGVNLRRAIRTRLAGRIFAPVFISFLGGR